MNGRALLGTQLADYASEAIIGCDRHGRVNYWNPAAEDLYGWSAGRIVGRNLIELASDADRHASDWAALFVNGAWEGELTRLTSSGSQVTVSSRRLIRRDESGGVYGVVEIGSGTVASQVSMMDRHLGQYRNQQLIRFMPAALWQVDSRDAGAAFQALRDEGVDDIAAYLDTHPELIEHAKDVVRVTDANLAAVALFRGRSTDELIKPVRYLFAAVPEMAKRVMVHHFNGSRSYQEHSQILTFDGQIRDVVFSVTYPTQTEVQDNTFILIEDITDRRRLEIQLRRMQADYSHAARISTLGELATSIAHEIKQPLSAVITNAETSLRWLAKDPPNTAKLVQLTTSVVENARHANEILQRIRSMATKHEPSRTLLAISDVINEATMFVRHDVETRSIGLTLNMAADLPAVWGDRIELQQVFVNLLVNAIQAVTPLPIDRRRVVVDAASAGDHIRVRVRDTGPGISRAIMSRLFEGFFTTKEDGMGMGLAICQTLIDAHSGTITAANQDGHGALFEVLLPVAQGDEVDGPHVDRALVTDAMLRND